MSLKWTANRSESGILRKSEFKEKKEELFVFGYSCKLFRDNEKALHIDQGKHLIPWMGDETLKIDRYDARGALHELSALEAPSGGFDWRVELTRTELDVEQLCDEERYRALHTNEDEEEMYKEEELKRLHAAGYGQVGFNYDTPPEKPPPPEEVDEPFVPAASFKELLPENTLFPETQKQNAIIEKTAKFIASQGAQMEILIKAKQNDNPQFKFLNKDSPLHPYYSTLISLVKADKWPEKKVEVVVEEKPLEPEEYLHPSLASTIIELAPSIPSIQYRPSADCDYSMLISELRGSPPPPAEDYDELPPPGTAPLPPRPAPAAPPQLPHAAQISRAPVMYNRQEVVPETPLPPPPPRVAPPPPPPPGPGAARSTGLSLMSHYNTDTESDTDSDTSSETKSSIPLPPEDVRVVIDKMAAYVARNGDEFAEIVRAKNDPRFIFLEPTHEYHPYYKRLMQIKRGVDMNGSAAEENKSAPVSFSIKKLKEPDPILPKPALPYESSSEEEESESQEKAEEPKEPSHPIVQTPTFIPPVIVYRIENQIDVVRAQPVNIQPTKPPEKIQTMKIPDRIQPEKLQPVVVQPPVFEPEVKEVKIIQPQITSPSLEVTYLTPEVKVNKRSESHKKEKRKHRDEKRERRSKAVEEKRSDRKSLERDRRKEKETHRERKRHKAKESRMEENEVISLVDNTDEFIDLTGEQSDSKGELDPEADREKQQARRRRCAEFLAKVGVDPAAAALPASSLAHAMVDTLETIRKKKEDEEEKRRKREKRRHRDRHGDYENGSHRKSRRRKYRSSDDNEESDCDGKKKKRRKDKKHSSKSKKRRRRELVEEEEEQQPLNIDLTNTLKELRHSSPTKELVQDIDEGTQQSSKRGSSIEEDDEDYRREEKKKKKDYREYSEGEWSSDSENDSESSASTLEG